MMRSVAIVQSNYIPWRGYFDLIKSVSDFVFYDEVQFTKRDWRNRNQIKTKDGLRWLGIPVQVKGKFEQKISEVVIADNTWRETHLKTLSHCYSKAAHFSEMWPIICEIYGRADSEFLSEINERLIQDIMKVLGINTTLYKSSIFTLASERSERLLNICLEIGANKYVSGPSAKAYLDLDLFEKRGVEVEFFNYDGYPEYSQLHGEYVPNVSIIDLLFNVGKDAAQYLCKN